MLQDVVIRTKCDLLAPKTKQTQDFGALAQYLVQHQILRSYLVHHQILRNFALSCTKIYLGGFRAIVQPGCQRTAIMRIQNSENNK